MSDEPKTASIGTRKLAEWSNLTQRRVQQLCDEGKLPKITNGKMPMPAAVQALFRHYQNGAAEFTQERLMLLKAQRQLAQEKLKEATGGRELVPIGVVETAAKMAAGRFDALENDLTCAGITLDGEPREVVRRLAREAKADCLAYVQQWLERQKEMEKTGEAQ